ncbi:uncharacterized protein LOC108101983 isoform X2 [Drosophila ficusphila]|uniref:uncharacterized protein LOC108101983 isoform X2 n=1 Tax=Drosophila ficusphila TaxID=30025 RepID=UPI0007E6715F|nr:uncharacterized protein LOC108101983 isoform X2 [Drosophila ficusphila]
MLRLPSWSRKSHQDLQILPIKQWTCRRTQLTMIATTVGRIRRSQTVALTVIVDEDCDSSSFFQYPAVFLCARCHLYN